MNRHETEDVCHETVDAGADIEVLLRTAGEDLLGGPEVLEEVMSAGIARLIGVIKQHRLQMAEPDGEPAGGGRLIAPHIAQETGKAPYRPTETIEIDTNRSKPAGHL